MKRTEQKLANLLKKHNLTVAFAESMTCGLAASSLGSVSGTSEIFSGSIVCYDEKVKSRLLSVSPTLLKKFTAESQQVTDALAKNLSKKIVADIHAAVTGLAAPGGSETKTKPTGTVFISVYFRRKLLRERKLFRGSPLNIRSKACDLLFRCILRMLKQSAL